MYRRLAAFVAAAALVVLDCAASDDGARPEVAEAATQRQLQDVLIRHQLDGLNTAADAPTCLTTLQLT